MSRLSALLKPSGDFGTYRWQISNWSQLNEGAKVVRESVFIKEQQVPSDIELDEHDITAVHMLVTTTDGEPIATARMIKSEKGVSHLGRMAVLFSYRGEGLGRLMLTELMQFAHRRRDVVVTLNAQSHAIGFYKKFGFIIVGEPYLEANIPHVKMQVELATLGFIASKS